MDIRIQEQAQSRWASEGGITLEVTLDLDDLAQLKRDAMRALEIERSLPEDARTELADEDEAFYINDFIKTRTTNDALESYNIVPVAIPHVDVSGLSGGSLYTCCIHVHPRPEIGLTSLDPVDLKTKRVPKPGFSAQAARAGDKSVEFLDDEKVLRMTMIDRLDSELPESSMRALGEEYQNKFERELSRRNINPDSYKVAHGLDDEQYLLMMARRALSDAHWNYVLDAVFVGMNYTLTDDDLLAGFESEHPGYGKQLMELFELRNEMYLMVEKLRRKRALDWLLNNVVR